MSHRIVHFLMLWVFVALQALVPFIHAHAGAVQGDHGGLLHLHQGLHSDAACEVLTAHDHAAEFAVAQGVPARKASLTAEADSAAPMAGVVLPSLAEFRHALFPRAPPPPPARADYVLPFTLAPPDA